MATTTATTAELTVHDDADQRRVVPSIEEFGMKHLLITASVAAAALAVAVPTSVALADAPPFSHRVAVRVPSHAAAVSFDDRGRASVHPKPSSIQTQSADDHGRHGGRLPAPSATPTTVATRSPEPRDDRGRHSGATSIAPATRSPEPGEDHGHRVAGDDKGQHNGDDATHHGGDDATHHGGDDNRHGDDGGHHGGEGHDG